MVVRLVLPVRLRCLNLHENGVDVTTHGEGHGRLESDPPGGLVEVLSRWESTGGHWRVLRLKDEWIEIGLFAGNGEDEVTRVSGARTAVLRTYLAGRTSDAE